jgi:predicted secreted protein
LLSTCIVIFNRSASNQKAVDVEVQVEKAKIDSISIGEVFLSRNVLNEEVELLILDKGSSDSKSSEIIAKIKKKQEELDNLPKLSVNRIWAVKQEKAKLEKQLDAVPESEAIEKDKRKKLLDFAKYQKTIAHRDSIAKADIETKIRQKHTTKDDGVNFTAIVSNFLYCLFSYVIIKAQKMTGDKSFDAIGGMFYWMGKGYEYITTKKVITSSTTPFSTEQSTTQPTSVPIVEETQQPIVAETIVKEEKRQEFEPMKTVVVNRPNPKTVAELRNVMPVKAAKTETTINVGQTTIIRSKLKLSGLKKLMIERGIDNIGGFSADKIWEIIANGRQAIIDGKPTSDSVTNMNKILAILRNYDIIVNPDDKMPTKTPELVISQVQNNAVNYG